MIFDLEDLVDEPMAQKAADDLVVDAIVASEATRRKRQKVRTCTAKIKMLVKFCRVKRYDEPIKTVKKSFDMLEEERGEMDVNLFGI
jgi:hypothetical protein